MTTSWKSAEKLLLKMRFSMLDHTRFLVKRFPALIAKDARRSRGRGTVAVIDCSMMLEAVLHESLSTILTGDFVIVFLIKVFPFMYLKFFGCLE